VPRRRRRWRFRVALALVIVGCAGAGGASYLGLRWLAQREPQPTYFQPEALPAPPPKAAQASNVLPRSALTFVAQVHTRPDKKAPIERYRGVELADVGLAVVDARFIDPGSLPPLDGGAAYYAVELAATTTRKEPVRIADVAVDLQGSGLEMQRQPPEFADVDDGYTVIPKDGKTVTFRAVFAIPRTATNLAVALGVWAADGRIAQAVVPAERVPETERQPTAQPAPPSGKLPAARSLPSKEVVEQMEPPTD